jgi:hypothetical protein
MDGLGFVPEYFVITNFELFNRKHQDLKAYLNDNCVSQVQTDQYQIYGSCLALKNDGISTTSSALWGGN